MNKQHELSSIFTKALENDPPFFYFVIYHEGNKQKGDELSHVLYIKNDLFTVLDLLLQLGNVGTRELSQLLTILEEEEGWHGRDAPLLGNLRCIIDVNLDEDNVRVRLRHLGKLWGNHLTWTAPCGSKVDDG